MRNLDAFACWPSGVSTTMAQLALSCTDEEPSRRHSFRVLVSSLEDACEKSILETSSRVNSIAVSRSGLETRSGWPLESASASLSVPPMRTCPEFSSDDTLRIEGHLGI